MIKNGDRQLTIKRLIEYMNEMDDYELRYLIPSNKCFFIKY
jgi:hypothetical protein